MKEEKDELCCSNTIVHNELVVEVKDKLPDEHIIFELAEFYKTFGDPTRVKIISALLEAELCVCDLAAVINTTQSAVSHQLRILRQARLVKYRKEGKVVYYSLDDEHIEMVINQGLKHISHR